MDLSQAIVARSDQANADDLVGGPQTVTVADVRMGDSEQPVWIVTAEWGKERPFKPSKTVLRILVHAWGKESDNWPKGARMTLYRDAAVKWAGQAIGGIRVSHLSHINGKLKVALQESKGKKVLYTVDPLPDAPAVVEEWSIPDNLRKKLMATYTEAGVTDRKKALTWTSWLLKREVTSRKTLTADEVSTVIDALTEKIEQAREADEGAA